MSSAATVTPMPSARIAAGHYEVLGTSRGCDVKRQGTGWGLFVDGAFYALFHTKRDALVYCQEHTEL